MASKEIFLSGCISWSRHKIDYEEYKKKVGVK